MGRISHPSSPTMAFLASTSHTRHMFSIDPVTRAEASGDQLQGGRIKRVLCVGRVCCMKGGRVSVGRGGRGDRPGLRVGIRVGELCRVDRKW